MESVDRFYRAYSKYLHSYDNDSLFNLLNSLHSLSDKLKSDFCVDLLKMNEFVTLKTIRNHLHHQSEMNNALTTIPLEEITPLQTDLLFMCLIAKDDLDSSIEGVSKKYIQQTKAIIYKTVHFYGHVVNISHVIFNMAAKLMVILGENKISGVSKEYLYNHERMVFDISNGYSVTVCGKIYSSINNVGKIEDILLKVIEKYKI